MADDLERRVKVLGSPGAQLGSEYSSARLMGLRSLKDSNSSASQASMASMASTANVYGMILAWFAIENHKKIMAKSSVNGHQRIPFAVIEHGRLGNPRAKW